MDGLELIDWIAIVATGWLLAGMPFWIFVAGGARKPSRRKNRSGTEVSHYRSLGSNGDDA